MEHVRAVYIKIEIESNKNTITYTYDLDNINEACQMLRDTADKLEKGL
jgi:hypothetical protein